MLYLKGSRITEDWKQFSEGIVQCKASITRVLDSQHCFDNVGKTIPINTVVGYLSGFKHSHLSKPKGPLKKMAAEKFKMQMKKDHCKKGPKYEDVEKVMSEKKKKVDPLDPDKYFLLDLVKKMEGGGNTKKGKKSSGREGSSVSGHALQILGYLNSREKFWEQI